jgi:hypothetical protein
MNKINLNVQPGTPPMTREVFIRDMPPFSVALDGFVYGAPFYDSTGPRSNFNHHEEVDRSATGATCVQVLDAIREGFFQTYRDSSGSKKAEIYVNDCDQDVCTAVFLLMNSELAENTFNPMLNRLVSVEGKLDASAGAYPYKPDLKIMSELAWVFEPYTGFRRSGKLSNKNDITGFESVIELVGDRIHKHLMGRGGEVQLDTSYEVLEQRDGYVVVREKGEHARIGMFANGINAFVSVGDQSKGSNRFTVGKRSAYIPLPVNDIFVTLNGADNNVSEVDRWGGGNLIGGSPRVAGSALSAQDVVDLIDMTIKSQKLK